MTVREQFEEIQKLDAKINLKQEQLDKMMHQLTSIRAVDYSADRVQCSPQGDSIGERIARIDELQQQINEMIDRFIDLKMDCMRLIDQLSDVKMQAVLYARYFDGKSVAQIAISKRMGKRTVQRMIKTAFEMLSLNFAECH